MKISACWITKGDEELEKLKKSVASVVEHVNSIHITANSEHSKTEKWCKQNGYQFSYLAWNKNFAEQRNFNFSQAPKDVDFIFWMDCDDILVGGRELKKIATIAKSKDLDCVYLTYWYSCWFDGEPSVENIKNIEITQMRERLINPRKMTWKKRIHETPVEFEGASFKHSQAPYDREHNPMAVLHTGAFRDEPVEQQLKRSARNREILELELEDERKAGKPDPRTILYLMKIYAEDSDTEILNKCVNMGFEYLELSGWDEERMACRVLMGRCFEILGDNQSASECFRDAIKEYALKPNPYIRLAQSLCNLRKYSEAYHWIKIALEMVDDKKSGSANNLLEEELISAQVLARLHWEWNENKNIKKASGFAQKIAELNPHPQNIEYAQQLSDLEELDHACALTDQLSGYLIKQGDEQGVLDLLQSLPQAIASQPFAVNLWNKYQKPRVWKKNEIAYYCGFAYEKWDATNLEKGIGGSETAVIELAKEWTKLGYKVYVYGNPTEVKDIDGVIYLPSYYFNPKDKFNILINWRGSQLVGRVSAKKFYVDLHDVTNPVDFVDKLEGIDKIMVKSQAHKNLLYGIPDSKITIVSNGIR